ncbi:hypothetical protein TNCV_3223281 [Trichonephila clavipes]|nr:hypothetical protein TNCV_3223281 [Trichonephila clavipes]
MLRNVETLCSPDSSVLEKQRLESPRRQEAKETADKRAPLEGSSEYDISEGGGHTTVFFADFQRTPFLPSPGWGGSPFILELHPTRGGVGFSPGQRLPRR